MNGLWNFSPSTQPLLQRLIENADSADGNNEWAKVLKIRHYGQEYLKNTEIINLSDEQDKVIDIPISCENTKKITVQYLPEKYEENWKDLYEALEVDLVSNFPIIVDECTKNTALFTAIANEVNAATIEKFCNHIHANTNNLNESFIKGYLEIFLPVFIVKQCSFTLDLLFGASRALPELFKSLFLPIIIQSTSISNNILHGFVESLSAEQKKDYLTFICELNLTDEQFKHHITSLITLYKDCDPTTYINSFIFGSLAKFSDNCIYDKNFGRLLLVFIQSAKAEEVNLVQLENIVDNHRSAFRKPCLNKLEKELKYKSE